MSNVFLKTVLKEIKKKESLYNKEISIARFQFFRKSNHLKVVLKASDNINNEEEDYIKRVILNNLNIKVDISILCYINMNHVKEEEIINKYWTTLAGGIIKNNPLAKPVLINGKKELINNKIIISYGEEAIIKHLNKKSIGDKISKSIYDIFDRKI